MESWQVEHQCPQCGGPVTLEETDRILSCVYCRTKLYLVPGDHFRYVLPARSAPGELLYIPYWRLRGLFFAWRGAGMDHRHVDTNLLALRNRTFPFSLGVRPQVMKLRFASPQDQGVMMPPTLPDREAFSRIGAGPEGPAPAFQTFIGETVSLIHAPLYRQGGRLYDAILRRPVAGEETAPEQPPGNDPAPRWTLRFVPTLCPECGWDLAGERDVAILSCRNCHTAWMCQGAALEKVPFAVTPGGASHAWHLPFWRIRPRTEDLPLSSYADLIRLANLPKVPTPGCESTPLFFWTPAFKIQPAAFLRWARHLTVAQPASFESDRLPEGTVVPANLDRAEAAECIRVIIAGLAADKRRILPTLAEMSIAADDFRLVYQPFIPGPNELIHEMSGLTIDRKALAFGMRL